MLTCYIFIFNKNTVLLQHSQKFDECTVMMMMMVMTDDNEVLVARLFPDTCYTVGQVRMSTVSRSTLWLERKQWWELPFKETSRHSLTCTPSEHLLKCQPLFSCTMHITYTYTYMHTAGLYLLVHIHCYCNCSARVVGAIVPFKDMRRAARGRNNGCNEGSNPSPPSGI